MSTAMEQPGTDVTEEGRGARRWLMVAAGVGAAAMIGGGAYGAVQFMGTGGGQPEGVLPATSAAFFRVDLDPSVGQKVAAVRFFQGLDPEAKAALEDGEWREYVWEKLAEDGDVPADLDYGTDIEPWLGDRAGVSVVPNGEEEPLVAVALQVKDGEEALAALEKMQAANADRPAEEQVEYYLADDYVVLTQVGSADLLRAAAEQGTLDGVETFTTDMDDLGDAGVASYWVDLERMAELDPGAFEELAAGAPGAAAGVSGALGQDPTELMTGRSAGALRLSPDAVELHGFSRGMQGFSMPTAGGSAHLVNDLPADTVGAISLENGADWVATVWDYYSSLDAEAVQGFADKAAEQGFTLPDDLETALGDSMTLSVGAGIVDAVNGMSETEIAVPALPVAYRVQTDTTEAQSLLADLGVPSMILAQRTDDGVLTLGLHQPYVDAVAAPDGRLGDDATYNAAVAEAEEALSVLYVNVNEFEDSYLSAIEDEDARGAMEKLRAVGMSSVVESADSSRFTLRFVADE